MINKALSIRVILNDEKIVLISIKSSRYKIAKK